MKNFETTKCMICGNIGATFINKPRDDNDFDVVRCISCGHVQLAPLPSVEDDEKYYKDNQMARRLIPKSEKSEIEMMDMYNHWADLQCETVEPIIPITSKILEVGSGYGWFVEKMLLRGYDITGLELSDDKRQLAKDRCDIDLLGLNLLNDESVDHLKNTFDVICMFHVLEHISDPVLFLNKVYPLLKPNGKLIIEVPNFDDCNKNLCESYKNFTYFRGHLSYFTAKTLTDVIKLSGFSNITITGAQRYSIENAIYWARNGVPHTKYQQLSLPDGLEWVNRYYKSKMEQELKSYAILAIADKV